MFILDFRVLCLYFFVTVLVVENLGAVNQNSSGARSSVKQQSKSVYSGLSEANGGIYSKSRGNDLKAATGSSTGQGSGRGFGLSAWGIIGVVVTVIVGGIAAYYVALFYPIVCKKQGKYDIMELTTV